MELNPATPIQAIDGALVLRLGVAALIGLALGLDRELRNYPAGLRTHGIVCFSAATMTVSTIALYYQLGGAKGGGDPLRLIQGVGYFIGLIAAGLVVVRREAVHDVHNLTTAVHLWLATVIGVACGAGQWPIVVIAVVVAFLMLTLLRVLEKRWLGRHGEKG
jgi:putative Mg2+ transporter-C (MgtC) family protein